MVVQTNKPEQSAVEAAYRENEGALSRFLRRFLDTPEDVEDTMHEAFLRAYQAERSKRIDAPRAFLFKTARNLALNELAKRRTHRTDVMADFGVEPVLESRETPELRAIVEQELDQALAAIDELSPRVRDVFILRKVHGLKQREIAKQLSISESTVEKHIAKGLVSMADRSQKGHKS